jgi:putative ATP-binding cassette transporter
MQPQSNTFKDAWHLVRPYFFTSRGRGIAWLLLAIAIGGAFTAVGLSVILNFWRKEFYNSLTAKDYNTFIDLIFFWKHTESGLMPGFVPLVTPYIVLSVGTTYCRQWLQIRWRDWLTSYYTDKWLDRGAYYRIGLLGGTADATDNPDQRISEDIRDFTDNTLNLGIGFLSNIASLFSFAVVLWGISDAITLFGVTIGHYLVWTALVYAIIGTWLTHVIGVPIVRINFLQQKVEADFRYAAVRVRVNAEGIALYQGEAPERDNLKTRFARIRANWLAFMRRYAFFNLFSSYYSQIAVVFPYIVVAPRYFFGPLTLGGLTQVAAAFGEVQGALSWIISAYTNDTPAGASLSRYRSIVQRLAGFDRAIVASHAAEGPALVPNAGDALTAASLTIGLPNAPPVLQNANFSLPEGRNVVISGRSGSGKSTLFRSFAGIWPYGSGTVAIARDQALFLPQRPYIPLGTLRAGVCYPALPETIPEAEILNALTLAGLAHLVPKLDVHELWAIELSGGEQQRLAIARALLNRPRWLFLDEATASLDPEGEAALYRALLENLPATTIVSITHRRNLLSEHASHLVLTREQGGTGTLAAAEV